MSKISMAIGEKPRFEWVSVDLIDVDSNYQRELDRGKVERMLAEFRWDHFGSVILAPKDDGRFAVTDGQHRTKVAELHPRITHVPAMIINRSGTQAEAENFLVINRDRKAVTPIERYWAGLAAGDVAAARIRTVLESAGCDVAPDSGIYKPHLTNAVTAIGRALERYGDKAVRQALETIRKAWPKHDKALRGTLIVGLARVIEANPKIDLDRMANMLRPKSFDEMTAHAEALRKISGGDTITVLSRTLADLYNKGLSANQIYFGAQR